MQVQNNSYPSVSCVNKPYFKEWHVKKFQIDFLDLRIRAVFGVYELFKRGNFHCDRK